MPWQGISLWTVSETLGSWFKTWLPQARSPLPLCRLDRDPPGHFLLACPIESPSACSQADGPVTSLLITPDSSMLVVGSKPNQRVEGKHSLDNKPTVNSDGWDSLKMWDLAEECERAVLLKNNEHVSSITISPDGGILLAAIEFGDKDSDVALMSKEEQYPYCGITMYASLPLPPRALPAPVSHK
jgi:hypothetical protein